MTWKKITFNTDVIIGIIWIIMTAMLVFFILNNVCWQVGDDAIIMRKTGSGLPFSIFDTINPSAGRFYPLAYYAYNTLLLFNNGYISAFQHYFLVAIAFSLFSFFSFSLIKKSIDSSTVHTKLVGWLALLFSFVLLQRSYVTFSYIFATIWVDYLFLMVFSYFTYQFYITKRLSYAVISICSIAYATFCIENMFLLPLTFGTVSLLFNYKQLTSKEKGFNWVLVALSLLFLLIYYFVVYRNIVSAYDGSHGENTSFLENAINMLLSQKILILAIILFFVRLYNVFVKKDSIDKYYDTMLLTGLSYMFGCFILHLNWGMYYFIAVLFVSFPLFYYLQKFFSIKLFSVIIIVLSLFYLHNIPRNISSVQTNRMTTIKQIETIMDYKERNYEFCWMENNTPIGSWDHILVEWKKESLKTYLAYIFKDSDYDFNERISDKTIVFYPIEYDKYAIKNDSKYNYRTIGDISGINIAVQKQ